MHTAEPSCRNHGADADVLMSAELTCLPLLHRGKVRDMYAVDDHHILIVTTDRLSAFDVILPTPVPGKGAVLNAVSDFWFHKLSHIVANHLSDMPLTTAIPDAEERRRVASHAIVVKRMKPVPVEAIVRGYLIGSGWKEYQQSGSVCGITLPAGLKLADRLPEPIFTPSTKAAVGEHDRNIDMAEMRGLIGDELAGQVRGVSLRLYQEAAAYALEKGIIIADTKFEFGLDEAGRLTLIDEVLTPDSSRFWPVTEYQAGVSPPSFDKQIVRDWLETLDWDKQPPGPALPDAIKQKTAAKYREALERLTRN